MKPRVIGHIFWIVQFVDVCIGAPRILATVGSCPCRSVSECLDKSELRYNDSQVSILPCENEDFARCCPTVPTAIEFAETSGNVQDQRNKLEDEADFNEILSASDSMQVEETLEGSSTSKLEPDESSTDVPTLSSNPRSYEDHSELSVNATKKEDVNSALSIGNYKGVSEYIENSTSFAYENPKLPLQQHVARRQQPQKTASTLEPRPSYVRISNMTPTLRYRPQVQSARREESTTTRNDRFVRPVVGQFAEDIQEPSYMGLISQVTRFHSHRTSPRKPVSFEGVYWRQQNKKIMAKDFDDTYS
ncbi:uncharacterized protein LOC128881537 [Hylaeus volcanicus]|uniref:uncharacterized protein LOC128881537 n=1 Tax=Hylaeus volcanicus TaxID=313075 RepID=UPI0023B7BF57|nr:uncharacterized protein LOC128881537 [Hylaeus volcanicus]